MYVQIYYTEGCYNGQVYLRQEQRIMIRIARRLLYPFPDTPRRRH